MTFNDLCAGALRLLGAIAAGEPLSAEDQQTGMEAFNAMLASWNIENLMLYTYDKPAFTLVPGKQDYTCGAGGDFDIARPNMVKKAVCRLVVGTSTPMDVPVDLVDDQTWANIPLKSIQGPIPYQVYNQGGYPLTTFSFFPVPNVANQFIPWITAKLTKVTDPSADLVFPDGYERAFRYNLALELSPEYKDCIVTPMMVQIAAESKANIKRLNSAPPDLDFDPALTDETPAYASSMANLYAGGRIR